MIRTKRLDETHLRAAADLAQQRLTCEGCAWLARHPRPMCKGENSSHYRTVRETYSERCSGFAVTTAPIVKDPDVRVRVGVVRR